MYKILCRLLLIIYTPIVVITWLPLSGFIGFCSLIPTLIVFVITGQWRDDIIAYPFLRIINVWEWLRERS